MSLKRQKKKRNVQVWDKPILTVKSPDHQVGIVSGWRLKRERLLGLRLALDPSGKSVSLIYRSIHVTTLKSCMRFLRDAHGRRSEFEHNVLLKHITSKNHLSSCAPYRKQQDYVDEGTKWHTFLKCHSLFLLGSIVDWVQKENPGFVLLHLTCTQKKLILCNIFPDWKINFALLEKKKTSMKTFTVNKT